MKNKYKDNSVEELKEKNNKVRKNATILGISLSALFVILSVFGFVLPEMLGPNFATYYFACGSAICVGGLSAMAAMLLKEKGISDELVKRSEYNHLSRISKKQKEDILTRYKELVSKKEDLDRKASTLKESYDIKYKNYQLLTQRFNITDEEIQKFEKVVLRIGDELIKVNNELFEVNQKIISLKQVLGDEAPTISRVKRERNKKVKSLVTEFDGIPSYENKTNMVDEVSK